MLKKAKEDLSLLMRSGKHIFVFELTYKLAATAIVYPLAVLVLNLVFSFAGISYLTNEYILKAVTNLLNLSERMGYNHNRCAACLNFS